METVLLLAKDKRERRGKVKRAKKNARLQCGSESIDSKFRDYNFTM